MIEDRTITATSDGGRDRAFFGRRKGHRLRPHQAALIEELLPRLAIDLVKPPDLAALFPRALDAVRLEIGFGGGEHLVEEARAAPDTGFIGCEPFVNGMAKILALIEATGIDNIRLYVGDAVDLLRWLPADSLARRRSALCRSLAEAAALEAPFRAGRHGGDARPRAAPGASVSLCERHSRLCRLDPRAAAARAAIRLDRRACRRLAPPLAAAFPEPATRPRRSARAACPAIWYFDASPDARAPAAAGWDCSPPQFRFSILRTRRKSLYFARLVRHLITIGAIDRFVRVGPARDPLFFVTCGTQVTPGRIETTGSQRLTTSATFAAEHPADDAHGALAEPRVIGDTGVAARVAAICAPVLLELGLRAGAGARSPALPAARCR